MHQEINSPDISKVYACVCRPVKSPMRKFYKHIYFTEAHGKVYQFVLMKENVHRGAHSLTGLRFAPSAMMF